MNENLFNSLMRRSHGGYSVDLYQSFAELIDEPVEDVVRSFELAKAEEGR